MGKTICFDLRSLQIGHESRGIGMHIKSILTHLKDTKNHYIFYTFDKNNPIKDLGIDTSVNYEIITTPTIKTSSITRADILHILKLRMHRFPELKTNKPDVFVQFDSSLSAPRWRKTKRIVIAYDLIPLIQQKDYLPTARQAWQYSVGFGKKHRLKLVLRAAYYRWRYRSNVKLYKKSNKLIAISKSTRNSFIDLLGIHPDKITAIPLAPIVDLPDPAKQKLPQPEKPFLFYVGGTDSRKSVEDIIRAYNIARGRGLDIGLVLAGNEFKTVDNIPNPAIRSAITSSPYKDDISLAGFITDAEKSAYYSAALAFIFCTRYEGFGLPVIEAMSASCPVISYSNSSIPEVAGDAAILVESGDYQDIAQQIINLDDKKRKTMIEKGLDQSAKFSWEKYTKAFLKNILS